MGSFDGAKTCELVDAQILYQLSNIIKNTDMGLYRDDGLIINRNPNGPKLDSYRKRISDALKLLGFRITIYTNLKIVNFLDVTLNLRKGTFEPYKKENDTPIYIHTSLNHPPSVFKQILTSVSRRLSDNSSNIGIFNKYKHIYDNALKYSVYRQTLKYTPPKSKPKHRNRNITWFNPPYDKYITSNIRRDFLNLISKHFPNHRPLAKIFSRNNIKVSYSCTSNISQIIKDHNKKIETIHSTTHSNKQCNCRDKETCPLQGNCLQKNVVYWGNVKTNSSVKQYIGATDGNIKQGTYNHKLSFTNRNYSTNTSLSTHRWHLKGMNISPTITWEILELAPTCSKT